jgi:hypothetical protein
MSEACSYLPSDIAPDENTIFQAEIQLEHSLVLQQHHMREKLHAYQHHN